MKPTSIESAYSGSISSPVTSMIRKFVCFLKLPGMVLVLIFILQNHARLYSCPVNSKNVPESRASYHDGQNNWIYLTSEMDLSGMTGEGSFDLYKLYVSAQSGEPAFGRQDLFYYLTLYDHKVLGSLSIDKKGWLTFDILSDTAEKTTISVAFVVKNKSSGNKSQTGNTSATDIISSASNLDSVLYDTTVIFNPDTYEETVTVSAKTLRQELKEHMSLPGPLVIVDGKRMESGFDINSLDVDRIEAINVIKDDRALELYGHDGRHGVVIIKTKE